MNKVALTQKDGSKQTKSRRHLSAVHIVRRCLALASVHLSHLNEQGYIKIILILTETNVGS